MTKKIRLKFKKIECTKFHVALLEKQNSKAKGEK